GWRWRCSCQAWSNIGDLAGIFTYSASEGTMWPSHADSTYVRSRSDAGASSERVVVMAGAYHGHRRRAGRLARAMVRSEAEPKRAVSDPRPPTAVLGGSAPR